MANLQLVTRPDSSPQPLPVVYLYGCPQESADVYQQLCGELLSEMDCAVQYEVGAPAPQVLTGIRLVAVAVTDRLLAQPEHLLAGLLQTAKSQGVPVLPLAKPELAKRCMRLFGGFDATARWCAAVQQTIAADTLDEPLVQLASFVCYRLGELHLDAAAVQAGIRWYGRDLELWNRISAVTGSVLAERKQLLACLRMGDACYAEVQAREAQYWYRKAMGHGERLVQRTGQPWATLCLAQCCNAVGDLLQYNENSSAAAAQYRQSMTLLEGMAEPSAAARQELAQSYGHMAELRLAEDDHPAAEEWLRKKLRLEEQLAAETADEAVQVAYAVGTANLAKTVLYQGRYAEAEQLYHKGLAILDRLWAEGSALAHQEWQSTCQDLNEFYQMMGDWKAAQLWLDAAMSGVRPQ